MRDTRASSSIAWKFAEKFNDDCDVNGQLDLSASEFHALVDTSGSSHQNCSAIFSSATAALVQHCSNRGQTRERVPPRNTPREGTFRSWIVINVYLNPVRMRTAPCLFSWKYRNNSRWFRLQLPAGGKTIWKFSKIFMKTETERSTLSVDSTIRESRIIAMIIAITLN